MKRFTETEKWRDPWFQKLSIENRTLWLWLCDRVDNSGVIDICWPICNAETSGSFSEASMEELGDKVERLSNGKWWLPGFTQFQVGKLSDHCKPHIYIINLLKKHNLLDRVSVRVCNTLKEKDKEKEKEKEKDKEWTKQNKDEVIVIPQKLLSHSEFSAVWNRWMDFRRSKKACKNFDALWRNQLDLMAEWGADAAIQSMKNSMANDWQGLFAPKQLIAQKTSKTKVAPISAQEALRLAGGQL